MQNKPRVIRFVIVGSIRLLIYTRVEHVEEQSYGRIFLPRNKLIKKVTVTYFLESFKSYKLIIPGLCLTILTFFLEFWIYISQFCFSFLLLQNKTYIYIKVCLFFSHNADFVIACKFESLYITHLSIYLAMFIFSLRIVMPFFYSAMEISFCMLICIMVKSHLSQDVGKHCDLTTACRINEWQIVSHEY